MQVIKINLVCIMVCICFLFNFTTIVDTQQTFEKIEQKVIFNGYTKVIIRGAELKDFQRCAKAADLIEIGNIPLRKQIGMSCGTTSFAMLMDYLDMPYRTQEFYDECANRRKGEVTYLDQLELCSNKIDINTIATVDYDIKHLKIGDIVLYHAKDYKNESDLHYSVVDSIDNQAIRLANPWNSYDEYTINEFNEIYINEALVLLK